MKVYCLKCRKMVEVKDGCTRTIKTKHGKRTQYCAKCKKCGGKVCKFVKKEKK